MGPTQDRSQVRYQLRVEVRSSSPVPRPSKFVRGCLCMKQFRPPVTLWFLAVLMLLPSGAIGAADGGEVTIERIQAVPPGSTSFTHAVDFSPSARFWLSSGSRSVKGAPEHWRLVRRETLQFPPEGNSRVIALPEAGLGVSAIELRHLPGRRPDWFVLYQGIPVGNAVPHECPPRYYSGFANVSKDEALIVTVHPPGPIEARPDLVKFEKPL